MAGQQPNRKYRPQTGDGATIYRITNCESALLLEGRLPGCQPGCLLTADCPPAVISNCALSPRSTQRELVPSDCALRTQRQPGPLAACVPPHQVSGAGSSTILGPLNSETQRRISHPGFSTPGGSPNAEPPAKAHPPVGLHPAAVRCPTTQRVHAKRPQRNPRCNTLQRRTNDQAGPCQGPGEKNTNETLFSFVFAK